MRGNKKAYVNISHLIHQHQTSHKDPKANTLRIRPRSQQNNYEPNLENKENKSNTMNNTMQNTRRVSLKLDFADNNVKKHSYQPNNDQSFLFEDQSEENRSPFTDAIPQSKEQRFRQLESLMVSDKMFIDPDRWQKFLIRCRGDEKFHRSLSAFLYSYFIQNYQ